MNRNTTSFYAEEPTIDIMRSMWTNSFTHKTTFNNGELVPFYVNSDILPGMTIKNTTGVLIRMTTPVYPTMDNLFLDTYWFKIPIWTVWPHWKALMGENEDGAWTQTTEYETPMFKTDNMATRVNDILTYMGIPLGKIGLEFSQLPVRAYLRTYNFWFRDQNLIAPIKYADGDDTIQFDGSTVKGGTLCKVAKFHDYFTSALPEPQKGGAVSTPLGTTAPILSTTQTAPTSVFGNGRSVKLIDKNGGAGSLGGAATGNLYSAKPEYSDGDGASAPLPVTPTGGDVAMNFSGHLIGFSEDPNYSGLAGTTNLSNVLVDLTNATASTINALRLAFATQRILEKDARYGTRYNEILRGQFGVNSPNASLHVPEYLGGKRIPINIETVLQNSSTDAQSPLGQTGAFSVSFDINEDFTKSFDEHCILLGLCCVRAEHTYQQGLAAMWSRKRRLDYYWPSLAHIGNQPIYNREIYAQGSSVVDESGNIIDNQVFGYKEAWAEYKQMNNRISGELLSTYQYSLDAWHYGDDYNSLPVLSQNWIEEPTTFVDRTLAVQSNTANQFIADFEVRQEVAAPMPVHCTPGLIDHF